MINPVFQYQGKVEVLTTSAEATTVDRCQPTVVQPSRAPRNMAALATILVMPLLPAAETTRVDRYQPTCPQPSRARVYASSTDFVAPQLGAPTADRWAPTFVQPSRAIRYAKGTDFVTDVSLDPGDPSAYDLRETWPDVAGVSIFGLTPQSGPAWPASSNATSVYQGPPVSSILETGDGFTYNAAAGSSLVMSTATPSVPNATRIQFALRCKTVTNGSHTAGIGFAMAGGAVSPINRFYYGNSAGLGSDQWARHDSGTGGVDVALGGAGLTPGQVAYARLDITNNGSTATFVFSTASSPVGPWTVLATDSGLTIPNMTGQVVGVWYDVQSSPTTGYQVGEVDVGPIPAIPLPCGDIQPSRAIRYARGTDRIIPIVFTPEATSVDRWASTCPQPNRAIRYASGTDHAGSLSSIIPVPSFAWYQAQPQPPPQKRRESGQAVVVVSTATETPSVDRYQPTCSQPSRVIVYARGTDHVGSLQPIGAGSGPSFDWYQSQPQPRPCPSRALGSTVVILTAPEATTVDRYQPTHPQPNRAIVYARGTDYSGSISSIIPVPSFDWYQSQPQPPPTPPRLAGHSVVSQWAFPEATSVDRWSPTLVQPSRALRYARGTDHAAPPLEATTADRWAPTLVHPNRAIRYARGTDQVGSPAPIAAPPVPSFDWYLAQPQPRPQPPRAVGQVTPTTVTSTAVEATTVDRYQPTFVQPSRAIIYARGTDHVEPPQSLLSSFDWYQAQPQPMSWPVRARGRDVSVVSADQEAITVDRWLPTHPQPSRAVGYARGTDQVGSPAPIAAAIVPPFDWFNSRPLQLPYLTRALGSTVFVISTSVESTSADRWAPTYLQPSRAVVYARGTDLVAPLVPIAPPIAPSFDWFKPQPQPRPALLRISGHSVASPWPAPETTTADRYQPTYPQPRRAIKYASGTVVVTTVSTVGTSGSYFAPSYFAPTYFTTDYWGGPAILGGGAPGSYFAPTYFAPTYFDTDYWGGPAASLPVIPVDRWAPIFVQPSRALAYARGTDTGAPVSVTAPATSTDRWAPTCPQPSRTVIYARGTDLVAPLQPIAAAIAPSFDWYRVQKQPLAQLPRVQGQTVLVVSTAAESPTIDRWAPTCPQPNRALTYAKGTDGVGSLTTIAATAVPPFDWYQAQPQGQPAPIRARGREVGVVSADPEATTADRWLPTTVQPNRAISYAKGTDLVWVVSTDTEATSVERWLPTFVQPTRAIAYAKGTDLVWVLSTAADTPTADRWLPTFVQPNRAIKYAWGTDTAASPLPIVPAPSFDWYQAQPQPPPIPTRLLGLRISVLSTVQEAITADRWAPTFGQPSRALAYARGTDSVGSLVSIASTVAPSFDWYLVQPQPRPASPRMAGHSVAVTSTVAEATSADRWWPTFVQPNRTIVRAKGTNHVGVIYPISHGTPDVYDALILGTSGLQYYWPLGETAGPTAFDWADTNPGTYTGAGITLNQPGIPGSSYGAAKLDGTTGTYIPTTTIFNDAVVSVECWFKLSAYPLLAGNQVYLPVTFANGNNTNVYDKALGVRWDGSPTWGVSAGSPVVINSTANSFILNQWNHLVGTADGTTSRLYLNGVQVGSAVAGNTYSLFNVAPTIVMGGTFTTGGVFGGVITLPYTNGIIQKVAVYGQALSAATVLAHFNAGSVTTVDRYQPTTVQPARSIRYARGTDLVAPLVFTPESPTVDRYQPTFPQPSRTVAYAKGTDQVGSSAPVSALTVPSFDWFVAQPQPVPTPPRSVGQTTTITTTAAASTSVDRWSPTCPQPIRAVTYARGTDLIGSSLPVSAPIAPSFDWFAAQPQPPRTQPRAVGQAIVITTVPEATTADRWLPTYLQPSRAIVYSKGTDQVGSFLPIAATLVSSFDWFQVQSQPPPPKPRAAGQAVVVISTAPESVTVDRYPSTFVQPNRAIVYARGTDTVAPVSITPATTTADRWAPTSPQPNRAIAYAKGMDAAVVLTTAAEPTSADRWWPTVVQPSRTIVHAPGTVRTEPIVLIQTSVILPPLDRVYIVKPEARVYIVKPEARVYIVPESD